MESLFKYRWLKEMKRSSSLQLLGGDLPVALRSFREG